MVMEGCEEFRTIGYQPLNTFQYPECVFCIMLRPQDIGSNCICPAKSMGSLKAHIFWKER